jgi:hypothetical protein
MKLNNLAVALQDMYARKMKTCGCSKFFIAALFLIARTWKQSRCPAVGKWLNYPTMQYYSAMKKNRLLIHTT